MKLTALRDFVAVCECGSLRAAARQVGVSQPAITRSIQELERELGSALLERHSQGVRPTAVGAAFLRRASSVGNELERARQEVAQLQGSHGGSLTVCMASVPQITLLPDALRGVRLRYPTLRIDLIDAPFHRVQTGLSSGSIDVYVGPYPRELGAELVAEPLFEHRRVVIGRRGHPLSGATSLKALAGCEWVAGFGLQAGDDELAALFLSHGLPAPRIAMHAHSALTYVLAIAHSDMLMVVPEYWARFPMWRQTVEVIAVKEPLRCHRIALVRHPVMPLTPAADYFCDLLRRSAAHLSDSRAAQRPSAVALPA